MSSILEALKKAEREGDRRLEAALVRPERRGFRKGLVAGLVILGIAFGLWLGYLASVIPPAPQTGEDAGTREAPRESLAPPVNGDASSAPTASRENLLPAAASVEVSAIPPPAPVREAAPPDEAMSEAAGGSGGFPLALSGVVYDPVNPMAIINGRFVGIGESVKGAKVLAIRRDSVQVVIDGKRHTLRINK